ncbi:HAD-IB family hydrolase [Clostridium tetani]|uniref:HAD-IB family hydrolase n=2 Tax=Clostridium tetani TaxID=1513 RepID=A0A4V1LEV7_CLOTA|nr:HAD-IB family hydrolase [Clostridium tetani]AVP54273.1 HAD-IB family hydrolase [Clostridium tetani]RXI45865.1 HAD-IB family hydrolase [Clostridium tetani]RXI49814.1 HAD-IB family hydrolase [Clostridium tetani]RXI73110.1 HAD-IB family hydrolase [Clostridium tetani]RXI76201.1 HAD-IB family hydrolase [Clostridium tetani]
MKKMSGEKTKLAIFDVDFTLTRRETLVEFYYFLLKKKPSLIKNLPRSIKGGFLYLIKIYDAGRAKEEFISFIRGITEKEMEEIVKEFYEKRLKNILYSDALATIKNFKKEGYKIYLISASAEFYLKELYNIKEVDKIIGTRFEIKNGKYTGKIYGENCKGEEKVLRLKKYLKQEGLDVDFKKSYMFSDSLADLPLFRAVGNPYLINFKKEHETIKRLSWK